MVPLYWFMFVSNHPPHWNDMDDATSNRCIYVNHTTTFVADPPASAAERERLRIFKADTSIQDRLHAFAHAYLPMLFERYPNVCKRGGIINNVPAEIKRYTDRYIVNHNMFTRFISECLRYISKSIREDNDKCGLTTTEVYKLYTRWCRRQNEPIDSFQSFSLEFKCYLQSLTLRDKTTGERCRVEYDIENDFWDGIVDVHNIPPRYRKYFEQSSESTT